jgi:hypothetical protein
MTVKPVIVDYKGNIHEDKLIIITFPGWHPNLKNQVDENTLFLKILMKDDALNDDLNMRVFRWPERHLLANEIGQIR